MKLRLRRLIAIITILCLLTVTAQAGDAVVYHFQGSEVYHVSKDCQHVKTKTNYETITLAEAEKKGLRPCKKCGKKTPATATPAIATAASTQEHYPAMPDKELLVPAMVERVVDGDTAWCWVVEDGVDVTHKVRFLLVDTPETVHPDKEPEPGGQEASDYTRAMLEGKKVWLEYDAERLDKYGRQLCHIWLHDGTLFNLHLVEQGLGVVVAYPPNTKYLDYFNAALQRAKNQGIGLWTEANNGEV
ncbi:MAG: thermonuclease family protein [Christensenellales bacterium]|jgi:endonuclease YncB( thermonuclease family)